MRPDPPGWAILSGDTEDPSRRAMLTNGAMLLGLAVSYAAAFGFGARYLIPTKSNRIQKLLVGLKTKMPPGSATPFKTPEGQTINVIHGATGFLALSDVCPHLGCKVYWDANGSEFVCPCHDGHFDSSGAPVSGPPADMGVPLSQFEVVEDGDLVFLNLRLTT